MSKKPYVPPTVSKYRSIEQLPSHLRSVAMEMLGEQYSFTVIIDEQRRYKSVPAEFASLLGYSPEEMIGMRIDDFTPSDTVDVESIFREFLEIGSREGFWLFTSRKGKPLLVTYRAKRADSIIEAEYVPLLIAA